MIQHSYGFSSTRRGTFFPNFFRQNLELICAWCARLNVVYFNTTSAHIFVQRLFTFRPSLPQQWDWDPWKSLKFEIGNCDYCVEVFQINETVPIVFQSVQIKSVQPVLIRSSQCRQWANSPDSNQLHHWSAHLAALSLLPPDLLALDCVCQ